MPPSDRIEEIRGLLAHGSDDRADYHSAAKFLLSEIDRLKAALSKINAGRHGQLNSVEMAVIALEALRNE